MYIYVHIRTYIHTYMYTHTYIHTYIHIPSFQADQQEEKMIADKQSKRSFEAIFVFSEYKVLFLPCRCNKQSLLRYAPHREPRNGLRCLPLRARLVQSVVIYQTRVQSLQQELGWQLLVQVLCQSVVATTHAPRGRSVLWKLGKPWKRKNLYLANCCQS